MRELNILLTNDDGISFPGLVVLRRYLSYFANTYVFAPSKEKSATSQAISIYTDVPVEVVDEYTYIVEGYPVDCVNIGLYGGMIPKNIDLVISGINKGVNMGEDVWYSGTVGAARHAYIHKIPALAISSGYLDERGDYERIASFLVSFIKEFWPIISEPALLNLNFPPVKPWKGIKWTKLGKRIYRDKYQKKEIGKGKYHFNLGGSILGYEEEEGADFFAYYQGYVSVTPLEIDTTHYELLERVCMHQKKLA